ncbi:hypothetical protein Clacol_006463 [Clathrus columnatus]|uniref:Uncharacterized protein n=1 Tax=Clathrus columnatus TaxID=1419009 RepID=A0AAV5AEY2_9AGAM|nr:hypothetical protein Clacol_006463 [Clathrus columnatus]
MESTAFDKSELNKVGRHQERAHYDKTTIVSIVREAKIAHVAFVDADGLPQCIPMIAAFEDPESQDLILYLHSHPSSRVYKLLSQPNVRVVATSTILDGYVLALSSFGSSMNYRSAVLHGYTLPLDPNNDAEKNAAFIRITDSTIPGRWDHAREPTPTEFKGTAIIRVAIDTASAKIRIGGPVENKQDLLDDHLTSTVWTGVVPVKHITTAPEPSEYSHSVPLPDHVRQLK